MGRVVASGGVRCGRGAECVFGYRGEPGLIRPGQVWHLDHLPDGSLHPSHAKCNTRAGQKSGGPEPGADAVLHGVVSPGDVTVRRPLRHFGPAAPGIRREDGGAGEHASLGSP
jgi:hypothetical protein